MSSFTEDLVTRKLSARLRSVEIPFEYHIGSEDLDETITVPKGFVTDFATVPRFLWPIFPPDGEYAQAAVLHDFMYNRRMYIRKRADKIFLEAMGVLEVPVWKQRIMYRGVRLFGWIPWTFGKKRKRGL